MIDLRAVNRDQFESAKGHAESLLRTLDICESFGQELSKAELRNVIYTVSKALRERFEAEAPDRSYFATSESPGPRKAIDNLIESTWYTGRQAAVMSALYAALIVVLLIISVVALVVSSRQLTEIADREQVVRVVTAWLMLIVSLSLIRNAWSYFLMYRQCDKMNSALESLGDDVQEVDALKQWAEYHVARAACPLIPAWLWRIIGPSLDDAWKRTAHNTS